MVSIQVKHPGRKSREMVKMELKIKILGQENYYDLISSVVSPMMKF